MELYEIRKVKEEVKTLQKQLVFATIVITTTIVLCTTRRF